MTSSVTLWAIHAGHSDWMPDWIIRNSAGADLKRKSGKVQQQHWWDHTSKSSGGFSGGQVAALVGPHHSAQVSIQVLHSSSWPWMQPLLVLQGAGHPQLPLTLVGVRPQNGNNWE